MADFRALHQRGIPCIMVNVWDRGTARLMQGWGAQALATSSAAHAFTLGRPDMGTLTRDETLAHAQEIVSAVDIPVSGDFENGFGESPETCAETVRMAAEVGLAGIGIEDTALPADDAYEFDLAVERIRAAAAAARALPRDFVLTARADGVLNGTYGLDEAIRRLQAFEAAGADCLYAPMPGDAEDLHRICDAVSAPVNVLTIGGYSTMSAAEIGACGAARISLGSMLARATHLLMKDVAEDMFGDGRFDRLARVLPRSETDTYLDR